ncbi:ParB/RepB/Spo0J family partition protein [Nocardia thailandica]
MPTATAEPDTTLDNPGLDPDTSRVSAVSLAPAQATTMDPNELIIGHNVRPGEEFDLDAHPKQVESIRRFGVRDPILAERGPDGQIVVVDGQVRALIARAIGLPQVPVYIRTVALPLDHPERQIERTADQLTLNDRRIDLTDSDRAAAMAYMLDLGATVTRVAADLQTDTAHVRKAATIARTTTASALLDDGAWSLDQLAVIADYEHLGDNDAVEQLSRNRWNFTYRAQRLADDRARDRARLTATLPYAAAGHPVLPVDPVDIDPDTYLPAEDLLDTDHTPVTPATIAVDPSHWFVAVELIEDAELVDPDTGTVIDPDTVDFDADTPDDVPAAGLRSSHGLLYRDAWIPTFYRRADQLDTSNLHRRTTVTPGSAGLAGSVEAERAAAEQARRQRRQVIELNKRGAAAKQRRLEFLARVVALRTPPPGADQFVAQSLSRDATLLSGTRARTLATELLTGNDHTLTQIAEQTSPGRARVISLGLVLAAHESGLGKDSWRGHSWQQTTIPAYLHYLAEVGEYLFTRQRPADTTEQFRLVDVELAAAGDLDPDTIPLDPNTPTPPTPTTITPDDDTTPDDAEDTSWAHAA